MIAAAERSSLTTALVIVPQREMRTELGGLLGMGELTAARFQVRPLSLTVIHYPGAGRPPVLQAVNLFDRAGNRAGLRCMNEDCCV